MASLSPFVERRSRARLRETPLRRRNHVGGASVSRDRRKLYGEGLDVAGTLELNLDRYPTKPAMLTFLQSLIYAAEDNRPAAWRSDYVGALKKAADAGNGLRVRALCACRLTGLRTPGRRREPLAAAFGRTKLLFPLGMEGALANASLQAILRICYLLTKPAPHDVSSTP